jgi:uncharacterized protein YndB with AHSA1/START domain
MDETRELHLSARGDREIVIARAFHAPRTRVFEALTRPALVKRWLLGPDGWSMTTCDIDLTVGGTYRYVWRRESDGAQMGMSGMYREIVPPERLVATERFDDPWYPGEALGAIVLLEADGRTLLEQTLRYESWQARDAVLASPMEDGLTRSYQRLASVVSADL